MASVSISRLLQLGTLNNPAATPMESALMYALDWHPKSKPDKKITENDLAYYRDQYGDVLDTSEQNEILSIFEKSSMGTSSQDFNLNLIAAARYRPVALGSIRRTYTTTDDAGAMAQTSVAPVVTLSRATVLSGPNESMAELIVRLRDQFSPSLNGVSDTDLATKIREINGLGPNDPVAGRTLYLMPDLPMPNLDTALKAIAEYFPTQALDAIKNALTVALAAAFLVLTGAAAASVWTLGATSAAFSAVLPTFIAVFESNLVAGLMTAGMYAGATHAGWKFGELAEVLMDASTGISSKTLKPMTVAEIYTRVQAANPATATLELAGAAYGATRLPLDKIDDLMNLDLVGASSRSRIPQTPVTTPPRTNYPNWGGEFDGPYPNSSRAPLPPIPKGGSPQTLPHTASAASPYGKAYPQPDLMLMDGTLVYSPNNAPLKAGDVMAWIPTRGQWCQVWYCGTSSRRWILGQDYVYPTLWKPKS
jgi:hypothetical protein